MDSVIIKVEVDDSDVKKLQKEIGRIPESLESSDPFKKMNDGIKQELGLLEQLRAKEKQLMSDREKSTDPKQIKKFNAELAQTQSQINKLQGGSTALGNAFKGAFAALGALGVVVGLAEVVRAVIQTTATFEKFKAVLTNTLGSQRAAAEAFELIQKTATTTPFSLEQVTEAYIKLANRGLKPTELALKSFADIAASQGKELDQFVEAALDATQGEFERLKEFGIKASKSGEQITFAFKGIKESVENTPEAINAFLVALGQVEGVAGATDSVSATLSGTLSNLGDNAGQLANSLGTILLPVINGLLKGVNWLVQGLTGLFNFIDSTTSDIAAWVGGWSVYRDLQKEIASTSESNAAAIKTETDQLNALYKSLINTTAGTEGRKKAIEALQAKYGDTINLQNLENAGLGEIAKSQQKANQEITAAIKIKQKNAEITRLTANINKGAYKDEADALKLAQDRIKELQGEITDLQKVETKTTDLTKEQIKQREKAYKDYIDGLRNLQKQLNDLRNENNLNKIVDENARKRTEIAQKEFQELAKLEEEATKDGTLRTQEYADVRLEIEKKYQLEYEKLKKEQFAKEKQRSIELGKDLVNIETTSQKAQSEAVKSQASVIEASFDERKGLNENWLEDLTTFHAKETEKEKTKEQQKLEIQKTAIAATQEVSNAAFEILNQQREARLEAALNAVSVEFGAEQAAIMKSIELRKSQGKNTEDLEKKLEQSREAQRKKEAQLKTEEAKKAKAAAIIQAIINTALAVASANTLIPPANIPAMILAGVAGAAQIALIAAQPIPKFAKGTMNVTGGTPNKDSVAAYLMPGESVFSKSTTEAYRPALENIFYGKVSPKQANELLAGKKSGTKTSQNSSITISNSIDSEGLNSFVEQNGSKTKVLNKRYHKKV